MTNITSHLSILSIVVSLVSLGIAALLAWRTKLAPAKAVGMLSYIVVWSVPGAPSSKKRMRALVPFFWLTNVGANPLLVTGLRIMVISKGTGAVVIQPMHSVQREVIESPQTAEARTTVLVGQAPFGGFQIAPGTSWSNNFVFPLDEALWAVIDGRDDVSVYVEIRKLGETDYESVTKDKVEFRSPFSWADWAGASEDMAIYYVHGHEPGRSHDTV